LTFAGVFLFLPCLRTLARAGKQPRLFADLPGARPFFARMDGRALV